MCLSPPLVSGYRKEELCLFRSPGAQCRSWPRRPLGKCLPVNKIYMKNKVKRINFQNRRVRRSADFFFNKTTITGERYKKSGRIKFLKTVLRAHSKRRSISPTPPNLLNLSKKSENLWHCSHNCSAPSLTQQEGSSTPSGCVKTGRQGSLSP